MGNYVNPRDMSKEQWLEENGKLVSPADLKFKAGATRFVCLVDNGPFTAAGICYDARELESFKYPDPRPKVWYEVPLDKLKEVDR